MTKKKVDLDTGEVKIGLPRVRHPYERERVQIRIEGESKTHQAHKDSCDVNNIIARYERTGELPPNRKRGVYADVTALQGDLTERAAFAKEKIDDFKSAQKRERQIKEEQQSLPLPPPSAPGAIPPQMSS